MKKAVLFAFTLLSPINAIVFVVSEVLKRFFGVAAEYFEAGDQRPSAPRVRATTGAKKNSSLFEEWRFNPFNKKSNSTRKSSHKGLELFKDENINYHRVGMEDLPSIFEPANIKKEPAGYVPDSLFEGEFNYITANISVDATEFNTLVGNYRYAIR